MQATQALANNAAARPCQRKPTPGQAGGDDELEAEQQQQQQHSSNSSSTAATAAATDAHPVADILDSFRTELCGKMEEAHKSMTHTVMSSVTAAIGKLDAANEPRFSRHDHELESLRVRMRQLEELAAASQAALRSLAASSPPSLKIPGLDSRDGRRSPPGQVDHSLACPLAQGDCRPETDLTSVCDRLPERDVCDDGANSDLWTQGPDLLPSSSAPSCVAMQADRNFYRVISAQLNGEAKFEGAAPAADGKIVFAPCDADSVGILDLADDSFQLVDVSAQLSGKFKFSGAAPAADGKIVFAPCDADSVGIFDLADSSFQLVDISAQLSGEMKFHGAAPAANGKIVFAPCDADSVGIFDLADRSFQLVDISAHLSGEFKFSGAVLAANGKIVFAPCDADSVGIFDPADDSFQLVDISAQLSGEAKFEGAARAANGKIVFAPSDADSIGIFDPSDHSFQLVDISAQLSGEAKFHGAAATANGKIVFAPSNNYSVGIFDPADDSFQLVDISAQWSGAFGGAVLAANGKIIFAPCDADSLGIFDPAGGSFPRVDISAQAASGCGLDCRARPPPPPPGLAPTTALPTAAGVANRENLMNQFVVATGPYEAESEGYLGLQPGDKFCLKWHRVEGPSAMDLFSSYVFGARIDGPGQNSAAGSEVASVEGWFPWDLVELVVV